MSADASETGLSSIRLRPAIKPIAVRADNPRGPPEGSMQAKIKLNGVTYDSLEAMPPEARKLYDTLLRVPELVDRGPDHRPDLVQHELGPLKYTSTVRRKLIVNGQEYADEAAMPPDVREMYQQAMRRMKSGESNVTTHAIHFSFELPGRQALNLGKSWSGRGPSPIDPSSAEGRRR